jgi:hypothetical protein
MNSIIENGQSKLRLWWDTYEMLFGDDPLGSDVECDRDSDSDSDDELRRETDPQHWTAEDAQKRREALCAVRVARFAPKEGAGSGAGEDSVMPDAPSPDVGVGALGGSSSDSSPDAQEAFEHSIPVWTEFGFHKMGGGSSIVNDTCNQAKLLAKMLRYQVQRDVIAKFGDEWDLLDSVEQEQETLVVLLGCWHHLRNLVINWGKKAEDVMMAELLKGDLEDISSRQRLEPQGDHLLRSLWKYFGTGQNSYKKGVGIKKFLQWAKKDHPTRYLFTTPRGDNGSRQDWCVDAAFDVYFNRDLYAAFLEDDQFNKDNVLTDSLFTKLTSCTFIGMLRARAVIKHKISAPFRFLSNSNDLPDFVSTGMSQYMDHLEDVLLKVAEDGRVLLDKDFEVFDGCYYPWSTSNG